MGEWNNCSSLSCTSWQVQPQSYVISLYSWIALVVGQVPSVTSSRLPGGHNVQSPFLPCSHIILNHVQPCRVYRVPQVMKHSLQLARQHEVTVDSGYAALVIGCCVVVGFATALDPGVNLMDAATPTFLIHQLTGRQLGRLYS
jgi:hypothetical protein